MLTSVTFCLVSVPMAERNVDQLTELRSKMIAHLAGQGKNNELDPQLVEMLEKLKCSDQRKELDALLGKINQTLIDIDSVKDTLDIDDSPGKNTRDKVIIEIEDCSKRIVKVRDKIIECMKQHTELDLMVKDVSGFATEFKDFELDISGISKLVSQRVLEIIEIISKSAVVLGLLTIGGGYMISGLGISAAAIAVIVGSLTCTAIASIAIASIVAIGYSSLAIGAIVFIVGGVSWYFVSKWRNETTHKKLLEDIQEVCKDLNDRNILGQLQTFKDQFNVQREALMKNTGSESYTDLNIFMKCYKDYKRGLEEVLEDPDSGMTKEQLSSLYSIPLRDRFNLSKADARQLILEIHEIMTRKQLNDS